MIFFVSYELFRFLSLNKLDSLYKIFIWFLIKAELIFHLKTRFPSDFMIFRTMWEYQEVSKICTREVFFPQTLFKIIYQLAKNLLVISTQSLKQKISLSNAMSRRKHPRKPTHLPFKDCTLKVESRFYCHLPPLKSTEMWIAVSLLPIVLTDDARWRGRGFKTFRYEGLSKLCSQVMTIWKTRILADYM